MLDGKVKYLKSSSHEILRVNLLVVLAINAKIADANNHFTECDMTKL